jgi:hypothetical protein
MTKLKLWPSDPPLEAEVHNQHLKPTGQNSLSDPISKNPSQKKTDGEAQGIGPEFKFQYCKKKEKKIAGSSG